jgi:hypothetical protein
MSPHLCKTRKGGPAARIGKMLPPVLCRGYTDKPDQFQCREELK